MTLSMHLWIVSMIYALINSSCGQPCPESMETLVEVPHCPQNRKEWDIAAAEKNCESIATKQTCTESSKFVYHCLMNEWANGTVEVCAPTWFLSGFCPMFSSDDQRVKNNFDLDCSSYPTPCATRYISSEAYKYPSCYEHTENTPSDNKGQGYNWGMLGISVGGGVLLLCIALFVIWCMCKRKGRTRYVNQNDQMLATIESATDNQRRKEEGDVVPEQTPEHPKPEQRYQNSTKASNERNNENYKYPPGYGTPMMEPLI